MFEQIRRSRPARWTLTLSLMVVAGYASNAVSVHTCERNTDRWLDANMARHRTNWPGRHASSEPAEYRIPWVVGVNYGWAVGDTGGEWGTRYYFCLPGLPIPIWNQIRETS
ncbi:hypothetical protein P12x_005117 [Tundrisphaera lichenicola]|uniref:hypothetical protein n=1 Tax=Tundrisphaera lichenicola TaxID=2029860 RepID=UPI003EBE22A0